MKDKVKIKIKKEKKAKLPVFIDVKLHEVLDEIKQETGRSKQSLVEEFIKFGMVNMEIVEDDEENEDYE